MEDVLRADWFALSDHRGRRLIHVRDGLGLVEHPGLLRAGERRGLHRAGFRLQHVDSMRVWLWELPDEPPPDEPPPDERARVDVVTSLRRWEERSRVVRELAVRTVRDVLGAGVADVTVSLPPDDEDEDAWEDWSCGDALQCPCGGVRRAQARVTGSRTAS